MNVRSIMLWGVLILILALVNYGVYQKELTRTSGQLLYLELAPVDPRSLIQGDYMRLDYALLRDLRETELPERGQLIVDFDEQRVGVDAAFFDDSTALTDQQLLINYHDGDGRLRIAAENYFFQEGEAEEYEGAAYAELRVSAGGDVVLTGLMDEELDHLGAE